MGRLQGKVALITGAGSGIGQGIAELFGAEGACVGVLEIQPQWARDIEGQFKSAGVQAFANQGDVSNAKDAEEAVRRCVREWGRLDILVNNAGTSVEGTPTLIEMSESEWDRVMAVNFKGPFLCTKAAAPAIRAAGGGSIINISSISARSCYPSRGVYSMSKAALENLTLQSAVELGQWKIRVNSISPGWFRTRMNAAVYERPGELARRNATIPLGRIGAVEDVARLAVFLASEESDYITGESIEIDGGLLAAALKSSADLARLRPDPKPS